MLVKYQNRIMALPMLCMIIIVLSACCFDEQKNETSNVNPKVQSVETVSVTRGNLTPTVSAHTTIIPALDFVLCSSVEGTFEACSSAGNKITEGGVIGKVSEEEIKSPVDATILSIISSNESVPKNYPLATAKYTGFALNIEAENFLKILPENAALKAKFQVVDGVGPTEAIAVVVPVSENAESTLQCLIGKDIDVKPGQSATVVITAETRKDDNIFISKRENEQQLPASLAKLFVIEYAATLADLDSIVPANYEAIQLTKPGSSVANIDAKKYFLHNLFAAMLVPSGNDAAYVVADYCGSILSPQAKNSQERINVFMEHLNNYLQNQGYENTILYDPSGYDVNALTTVSDLKSVSTHLLEKQWFRDIVSKSNYTATLPDGSTQTWRNTNTFLDQTSEYYNENVKGIKTGSLSNDYNLVVLYQQHGKEFLICSLGSQSDSSRYDDVNYILKTIDESDYLTK